MMFIYETLRNDGKITMSYTAFVFHVNKLGLRRRSPGTGAPGRKAAAMPTREATGSVTSTPATPAVAAGKCVISRGNDKDNIPFGKHPMPDWLNKVKG